MNYKLSQSIAKVITKEAIKKNYTNEKIEELIKKYAKRFNVGYDLLSFTVLGYYEWLTGLE